MTEEAESSSRATVSPLERPGVKAILIFIAAAYALSIMVSLIVGSSGGHESALVGLAYLSMFLPAVSVLIVSSATNEPPRVRWDHFPLRYLPVALFLLRIEDPQFVATSGKAHHAIVKFNGRDDSRVSGTVFEISATELTKADQYEPAGYKRISAMLASGKQAWVYADARFS